MESLTMFSMTQMTLSVSLCARLIESATFFKASDFVHAPTVDPGLFNHQLEEVLKEDDGRTASCIA